MNKGEIKPFLVIFPTFAFIVVGDECLSLKNPKENPKKRF